MRFLARGRLSRILVLSAAAAAALALIGVLFAWSGLYSVAASRGHWELADWFLKFGMRNSVETHARAIRPPILDDPDLVRLGASHYDSNCASCHGAPGVAASPVARRMLPIPPPLVDAAEQWKDRELFWIIRNGIKYTGMPAWATFQRDDEVWSVVAFLKRLPELDAAGYRSQALGDAPFRPGAQRLTEASVDALRVCARCHGAGDAAPASGVVPVLHGQSAPFLAVSLQAFAEGWRDSGIMRPVATALSPDTIAELAAYYAGLRPPRPAAPPPAADEASERGRSLAEQGHAEGGIPSCLSCHHPGALPAYPRLAGQNRRYMIGQLHLWRSGVVAATATAAIMAPIARRLTDRQIADVTAYFSNRADAP